MQPYCKVLLITLTDATLDFNNVLLNAENNMIYD